MPSNQAKKFQKKSETEDPNNIDALTRKHRLSELQFTQITELMKEIPFSNPMDAMSFCESHQWNVADLTKNLLKFVMDSREVELLDAIYFCDKQEWDGEKIQENLLNDDNFKWNSKKTKSKSKKNTIHNNSYNNNNNDTTLSNNVTKTGETGNSNGNGDGDNVVLTSNVKNQKKKEFPQVNTEEKNKKREKEKHQNKNPNSNDSNCKSSHDRMDLNTHTSWSSPVSVNSDVQEQIRSSFVPKSSQPYFQKKLYVEDEED